MKVSVNTPELWRKALIDRDVDVYSGYIPNLFVADAATYFWLRMFGNSA